MRFAEIVLRLGVTLVAWLVIYMHFVMLFAVHVARCPGGDASPWLVSMVSGVLALGAAFAIGASRVVVANGLRGLSIPLALLVPWAGVVVAAYWPTMSLAGMAPCAAAGLATDAIDARPWHRWWAPVQTLSLGLVAYHGLRLWRNRPEASDAG